tara:strand:+ start:197 stop:466 length:270 start_codon:yes stop_codon:yes gene_type:complete
MANYQFNTFSGTAFVDPIIKHYRVTHNTDTSSTLLVMCEVTFCAPAGMIGDPTVTLNNVPINTINFEVEDVESRIWDYLNDPLNGYIVG